VTTAAGILVAIEAMVIYNYFMSRLAKTQLELKLMAEEFVELLREQKPDGKNLPAETPAPALKTAPQEA
jgi:biopolymer transport protein ExbB/TolQ